MQAGGLPTRGAAASIASTGKRYGKISKIALVSAGNLSDILNGAFTTTEAS
jgi:hypothetical protein